VSERPFGRCISVAVAERCSCLVCRRKRIVRSRDKRSHSVPPRGGELSLSPRSPRAVAAAETEKKERGAVAGFFISLIDRCAEPV
jgi:hypothetical protein